MVDSIRVGDLSILRARPAHASRPPVLFVHGYFADATIFDGWLEFFAERGFPAYAVHLRGRGGSRALTDLGHASIDDFVADASEAARWLGTPAVVGHSMGGLIAQRLAARGDVRAAALVTPAPPRGISVLSPPLVIRQLKYLPAILRSRLVRPSRDDLRALVLNRVPPDQQDALLDRFIPDSGRAARDMSIVGAPVDASRVRCPVLVIAADEDRFVPKSVVARIAARYGAPLQTMLGHGHMIVAEPGWESVADTIARWLS
ncbi:MAG TPA: alpha/beta fold hydrolase [Gemmatimonadaceae bacterium]|nr:alpha/beta fold hydrolase [Gemmatimonadaceae bacterium]